MVGYNERVSHNNESILYKLVPICQFGRVGISSQNMKEEQQKTKEWEDKDIPNNELIKFCVASNTDFSQCRHIPY